MQLYRNRNEQMPEMQAPQQSLPMPQTMPANMEQMPMEQMPEMMPMEPMPQMMPQMMPMEQMPQMMPTNQMPQMMPMNQMPQMMPMNQMPQMMPMNQMPQMMPQYMPMCPYVMPNMNPYMTPGMMPQMNEMMPAEMEENIMPYNMTNPQMEDVMGAEENYKPNTMLGTENRLNQPILSNNPVTIQIRMRKEQTAYNNYGNPSGNADILYTGTRGNWTFDVPPGVNIPLNRPSQLVIRAVLDDHVNVPVRNYSARIIVNDVTVHNGPVNLQHGRPAGQQFTNWTNLTFNVSNIRRNNRITIINTSRAGDDDWIALDWMEVNINR